VSSKGPQNKPFSINGQNVAYLYGTDRPYIMVG